MKGCWGRGIGIIKIVFALSMVMTLILPLKFLVFILALMMFYIGFIIIKIG